MNNNFYFFSFKTGNHHSGHKGKHSTRGEQKHKAQHQLKHDIDLLKHHTVHHHSTPSPDIVGDASRHNAKIQAKERTHHNVLERRKTKGDPRHRKSAIDHKIYRSITKDDEGTGEKKTPINSRYITDTQGSSFNNYAHAYTVIEDNKHLYLILGITTVTVLGLALNNFKLNI
jgi:hypothetical protein